MALGGLTKENFNLLNNKVANEPKAVVTNANEHVNVINNGANNAPDNSDDILARVAKFTQESNPVIKSDDQIDSEVFSDKDFRAKIDSLKQTNPELARDLELMRKQALTGINNKFQDLAEMRKEVEMLKNNYSQGQKPKFSANSIEDLLNNPDFIAEAQRMTNSDNPILKEEALSDQAKAHIQSLEKEIQNLKGKFVEKDRIEQDQRLQQATNEWNSYHERMKQKYSNYDSSEIDRFARDLAEGKIQANPELLYKALKFDENIQKAYKLGLEEGSTKFQQKQNNNSFDGIRAVGVDVPIQEKGEDNKTFLQRVISHRLSGLRK